MKLLRITPAKVTGIFRRHGIPLAKTTGRKKDRRTAGVHATKQDPVRVAVYSYDPEETKRAGEALLEEGYHLASPVTKRWIRPGGQFTDEDVRGGTLIAVLPNEQRSL